MDFECFVSLENLVIKFTVFLVLLKKNVCFFPFKLNQPVLVQKVEKVLAPSSIEKKTYVLQLIF